MPRAKAEPSTRVRKGEVRIEVHIPAPMKKALRRYCVNEGLTMREGVEAAIAEFLGMKKLDSPQKDGTPAGA